MRCMITNCVAVLARNLIYTSLQYLHHFVRLVSQMFMMVQVAKQVTQDNKHSQAASFTQARTHACILARQLQDSQADIKELMAEVAEWQKAASETAAQLQQRDAQVLLPPYAF